MEEAIKSILEYNRYIDTENIMCDIPKYLNEYYEKANLLLDEVEGFVLNTDRHDYFKISRDRYVCTIASVLSRNKIKKILDIGCAPGHVSMALHNDQKEVHGIDLNSDWACTYPSKKWVKTLNIQTCDIENNSLPFCDKAFDCVIFTEVLEHISIKSPIEILKEIKRVTRRDGIIIISTPNICNISNIISLMDGKNVFWDINIFYGSLDRHNREFTPNELMNILKTVEFQDVEFFLINSHCNWNSNTSEQVYRILSSNGNHSSMLLKNTNFVIATV